MGARSGTVSRSLLRARRDVSRFSGMVSSKTKAYIQQQSRLRQEKPNSKDDMSARGSSGKGAFILTCIRGVVIKYRKCMEIAVIGEGREELGVNYECECLCKPPRKRPFSV